MNISAPFIKRPIGTSLLATALLMAGALAFNFLPVAPLPQVEFPVISVSAGLPGASPETMASAVATPLERQFGRIAGINQMTSTSQLGSTNIVLQFDLSRNIDGAARDVQAAINAARSQLPSYLPGNPTYRKVNPADAPIMILALTSDTIPLPKIYDAADSILAQKLAQVDGVGQVFVGGGAKPAVRAEVNPMLLNKLGVGLDSVRTALSQANANTPKGEFSDAANSWAIHDNDQIFLSDQYRNLIVAYKNGAPVRLADVADVQDAVEDIHVVGLANGKPGVLMIISRQPGANIIATVDRVYAALPQLQASISPAIAMNVVLDRTTTVRASVHDTIVVLENITRFIEQGMTPVQAAFRGAREIGFTVLSMSTSLVAVFIPILLMQGLVGRLFREFAVVLSTAIAMSLVISLTVTPMLCAKFLRPESEKKHGRIYRASERGFDWMLKVYRGSLGVVLRHQPLTLLVTIGTAVLSVVLYWFAPKGFFPQQDTGRLGGAIQAEQDISFPALRDKMQQYVQIVLKDPAVNNVVGFSGGQGSSNTGRMFVVLKPPNERKATADQIINRLRGKLAVIPGATLFLTATQDLNIGGRFSNAQFQYTIQSEDLQDLNYWAPRIQAKLRTLPELRDVNSDQQDKGLAAEVIVDRDTASRLGVTAAQVDGTLYASFGQAQVSTMYKSLNQYHVVMEVDPTLLPGTDALRNTYVKSSTGVEVPLSSFTRYQPSNTALQVNHQGFYPAVTLSFNLAPGVPLGNAAKVVEGAMRDLGVPASVHGGFQGTAAAFKDSAQSQPLLILTALITVYIVLGMLYESVIHPITILSTLPSAGVGAILAIMLTGNDLNVIAIIGIILLIGIVKKNAILMIDFAVNASRLENKTPEEAIFQACLLRLRRLPRR